MYIEICVRFIFRIIAEKYDNFVLLFTLLEFQNVGATSESRQAEVLKLAVEFSEFIQVFFTKFLCQVGMQ